MYNFVLRRQPKAYQGSKTFKSEQSKTAYTKELENALKQFNTVTAMLTGDLYAVVYYFQKRRTGTDADNISKPIWDCLKGILFDDDKRIKLRTAGVVDLSGDDFNIVDFSNVRGEIVAELIDALEASEHFVYIECGVLNNSMYKFNWEANGN